jgi:hypothetical protein
MLSVTIFLTFIDQNTLFLPKQHQNASFKWNDVVFLVFDLN